jgi:nitrogen fixation protein NifB
VNREVKKRGAFLHNIMPLISEAEHGTVFGLTGQRGPSAQELKAVQDACMGGANLMRHCRQCRADAVGLLGEDRSDEFTLDKIDADGSRLRPRQAPRLPGAGGGRACRRSTRPSRPRWMRAGRRRPRRRHEGAGGRGHRRPWQGQPALRPCHRVPDLRGVAKAEALFVGHRRVDLYCQGGYGEDEQLPSIVGAINDCHAVLVSKIGACPRDELSRPPASSRSTRMRTSSSRRPRWTGSRTTAPHRARRDQHQPRGDARIRQGAYTAAACFRPTPRRPSWP